MRGWLVAVCGGVLTGCAVQAPAPVISGYGQPTTTPIVVQPQPTQVVATADARAFQAIEPAAGPVMREDLGPSAYQPTKPQSQATLASLPPPSLLGDLSRAPSGAVGQGWQRYQVQRADTMYRLAREFDTSPAAIVKANGWESSADMMPGEVIVIPAGLGRFAKADDVALLGPVPQAGQQAASQAASQPSGVVQGPSGTRYQLTQKVEAQQQPVVPAMAADDIANLEPAAGDVKQVGQALQEVQHKVVAGETVYRIAQKYGASVLDIMTANELDQPQDLKAGMVLKVPQSGGGAVVAASDEGVKVAMAKPSTVTDVRADLYRGKVDAAAARAKGMVWPVRGDILKRFGSEGQGAKQSGISIKASPNSPVLAAEAGTVVYADNGLKTYGHLVLLRHKDGMVTAYAHNNALLVEKGEKVKKGQTIALSGNTGAVKEPQVHFEVRKNNRAIDPLSLLPR